MDKEFPDQFICRLAMKSHITRARLDELVRVYGFRYIQANTLYVFKKGFKHFGSDLLKAYRENPARAKLDKAIE